MFVLAGVVLFLSGLRVGFDGFGKTVQARTTTITQASTVVRTIKRRAKAATPSTSTVVRIRTRVESKPPTGHGITLHYGAFAGKVRIIGSQWHAFSPTLGVSRVDMQVAYTGGLRCSVLRLLAVDATLFDASGRIAETSSGNASSLARGVAYPVTIRFLSRVRRGPIELVVATAQC